MPLLVLSDLEKHVLGASPITYPPASSHMRYACTVVNGAIFSLGKIESLQVKHCVHFRISHLLPDLGADDIDFFLRVPQCAREQCVGESFEAFFDLEVVPGANLFLF